MVILWSAVAGILLGALDFVWIKYVPFPWGDLGNSMAVWAVAAFLLTFITRWSYRRGVTGSVVMLVVAVPAYYLAAVAIQNDDLASVYNPASLLWMAMGVVAGVVFGAAGVAARQPWRGRVVALSLPAGVLVAEALIQARRDDGTASLVAIRLGLAAVLTLAVAGTWRSRAAALACAVPVGLVGFGIFSAVGIA
jgi:hypothetical protein